MDNVKLSYHPQLDGLRAICIIFTIFNHIEGTPLWINGGVGVDIFFALSGFLITTLMILEKRATGSVSLKAFYIRRVFRIVPLYLLAFGATALVTVALGLMFSNGSKLKDLIAAWPWILSFNRELCPESICGATYFGHAWTIGIEEKFYVIWPLIFLFAANARLLLLGIVAAAAMLMAALLPEQMIRGYLGLSFGCVAALWHSRKPVIVGGEAYGLFWLLIIAVGYVLSSAAFSFVFGHLLVSFGSSWLIVALVNQPNTKFVRLLSATPLVWVGRLTYGVYLFHVLILNLVKLVAEKLPYHGPWKWLLIAVPGYALSVGTAFVLYKTVEQPLIRLGKSLSTSLNGGVRSHAGTLATINASDATQP